MISITQSHKLRLYIALMTLDRVIVQVASASACRRMSNTRPNLILCSNNSEHVYQLKFFDQQLQTMEEWERTRSKWSTVSNVPRNRAFHVFATTKSNRRVVLESSILSARRTRIRGVITWFGVNVCKHSCCSPTTGVKRTTTDVVLGNLPTE